MAAEVHVERALQGLVDALSGELERPVLLDDAALRPLAYSRQWGAIDSVRSESILSRGASPAVRRALFAAGIAGAREPMRTPRVPELGMEERLCVPVRAAGEPRGYLWLLDDARLDADGLARAQAAAARAAELLAAEAPARSWLRDEAPLLSALWSPRASERAGAVEAIRERELLPGGPYVVVLIGPRAAPAMPEAVISILGARLSAGYGAAGRVGQEVALLLSPADPVFGALRPPEIASRLLRVLRERRGDGLDVAVGQSAVLRELDAAGEGRRQAALALRVARGRPAAEAQSAWEALGADRLVGRLPAEALEDLPPGLATLLRERPPLADTLAAFLDHAGDVPATAAALDLHRSGVYHRLRRIAEITGLDLARGDDRLLAHVALRLARLR